MLGTPLVMGSAQSIAAISTLTTLQDRWVQCVSGQGVHVIETTLPALATGQAWAQNAWFQQLQADFAPAALPVKELYIDPQDTLGWFTHPDGSLANIEFLTEILQNIGLFLGASALTSTSTVGGDWAILRLLPPVLLLMGGHYVFGTEALGVQVMNRLSTSSEMEEAVQAHQRPYYLSEQTQTAHGQQNLDPYWVSVHDFYHHLRLGRLGRHGCQEMLQLRACIQEASGDLAGLPNIRMGLDILLDGPTVHHLEPSRFYYGLLYEMITRELRRGTPRDVMQDFAFQVGRNVAAAFPENAAMRQRFADIIL